MKRLAIALIIEILLCLPVQTRAGEKMVFTTTEFPPYIIVDNGKIKGIHVETIAEICKRLNIEPDIQILPWARAIKYMKDGEADAIFSPLMNEERTQFMYFSPENIGSEKTVFAAKKGKGVKVSGLNDLKDKNVGVVRGYDLGTEFEKSVVKKTVCDNDKQMMLMLEKERIDLAVGDEGVLKLIRKMNGFEEIETVFVLREVLNYVCFSKKALGEKGKILAEKFGNILHQLKEEGFFQQVESKYF